MKRLLFASLWLLVLVLTAQGQVTKRVPTNTSLNPPTVCTPGLLYSNNTLSPARLWEGNSAGGCTRIDAGAASGATITSVTNLITGDGAGNGADSGIVPANVPLLNAANVFSVSTQSPFFVSAAANPADAGAVRLGNNEFIEWEKATPGTDWLLGINSSDALQTNAVLQVNLNAAAAPTGATGTGIQLVGTDSTVARVETDSFAAIAAFTARRANGTGASPTALASSDQIGAFNFHGYYVTGGPGYSSVQASLQAFATQNWTSTNQGTKIVLNTTPNNSTTLTSALTLDQDQSALVAGVLKAGSGPTTLTDSAGKILSAALNTVAVANGGTACTSATITCFNNITGFSAAGTTGTTSTNLVFSASPTLSGTLAAAAATFTGDVTHSGAAIILSGNISGSGIFGTSGIRIKGVAATFNDTTSSGTIAAAYNDTLGGNTLTASAATTLTDYNTLNITPSTASTNVTITRKHSLGILDSTSASSSITGGVVVAAAYGTAATSVGIGGGNVWLGGTLGFGSNGSILAPAAGVLQLTNSSASNLVRVDFGLTTNSGAAIGFDLTNSLTLQSAAGTATWNDSSTGASGTVANRYMFGIAAPTVTASSASVTNTVASTFYIGGAPTDSTNTTSTTKWALLVAAGNVSLSGSAPKLSDAGFATCTALTTSSNILTCTVSDKTVKQDFKPFSGGLDFIRNVTPQTYSFRSGTQYYDNGRIRLGLVAQEVQGYLPTAVLPIGNGLLQVDYNAVVAAHQDAIRQLLIKVDWLESEVKELKAAKQ